MKILLTLALSLGAIASAPAMQLDARTWAGLEKIDVAALRNTLDAHVGRLVELHCSFRGKDVRHFKPGWFESSVWSGGGDEGFVNVRVMVSQKDLATFKSLPTSGGGDSIMLYGKVLRDSEGHFVFVRLIGRKAVVDQRGKANVTW